ncbi:MAG: hypothetical protein CM15mV24_0330 [Bellamyvirus sp.]|nr:MAG: hypothetical protein CM15mV24_0330 [Bellamyvirus sp.]
MSLIWVPQRHLKQISLDFLDAINKADGKQAIEVLRSYADYEMAEVVPVVITKPVPVPSQMGMSKKSFNKPVMVLSGVSGSFQDTLTRVVK